MTAADAIPDETEPQETAAAHKAPAPVVTVDVTTTPPASLPPVNSEAPVAGPAAPAASADGPVKKVAEKLAEEVAPPESPPKAVPPSSILTIDIGGTKVKILATGQTEPRKAPSGKEFTPARLVETVQELAADWEYEALSIGYPGLVGPLGPRSEPGNLGPGWVGFDFAAAFGKPVKMVNDAAMQALGSYEGGRMLFLGLGTGLGSALITGHVIVPLELGRLMYDGERTLGEVLGRKGLERIGKGDWRKAVEKVTATLMGALLVDYVVIGGGNAKQLKDVPPGARRGHNLTAFRGGFRLWSVEDVWVLAAVGGEQAQPTPKEALRLL
jgi:hypothetical protein